MTDYPRIILKKGKDTSLKRYHPWVYSGAIQGRDESISEGDIVEVFDSESNYLATGYFQPESIMVKVFSFEQKHIDLAFWREKLRRALGWRKHTGLWGASDTNMFRLVHGEGDGLPGLIIDYYGGVAVIKCYSMGIYRMRQELANELKLLMGKELLAVYDKSASALPFKAPVTPEDKYLIGTHQDWEGLEYGNKYAVDIVNGQKTGFFIDQRENRKLLEKYSYGRKVLNTFCYTGGFSVAALNGGAREVVSVDSSAKAIEWTERNIHQNFSGETSHESITEDAFEYLKKIDGKFDLIVLDPPAFGKHIKVLDRALKGYRKINRHAIEQIKPGGILFTFSCSQVVSRDDFRKAVFTAAAQSRRNVRILQQMGQPEDHPVNIYHPEGEYLKGLVLAVE